MAKTLGDLALYMKSLLPQNIAIELKGISDVNEIVAFNDYLIRFFDQLMSEEDIRKISLKRKNKFTDETTLTVECPFFNNLRSILINIGEYGRLIDHENSLTIDWKYLSLKRSLNKFSTTKISIPQMIKSMNFLSKCGIHFDCLDSKFNKNELPQLKNININYTDNPLMLKGLKILGVAQRDFMSRKNDDIVLRCDYKTLLNQDIGFHLYLNDFIQTVPESVKGFISDLHYYLVDSELSCSIDRGFLCYNLIYTYKKKLIVSLSTSFHNGSRIILKTKNTSKYMDLIDTFPDKLKDRITKGFGCDRKNGKGHGNCQRGCEGFSFPLEESLLDITNNLKKWINFEISTMNSKTKLSVVSE